MKAIQSFRSDNIRPALESFGGPAMLKHRIMLMALSAASIARYYPDFRYVTDDAGKYMAEECKFPYTEIVSVGENFDSDMLFWVHSKFAAYGCKEPFLHFDNDLILWAPLPDRIHQAEIVGLHGESFGWPTYESWLTRAENISGMPRLHDLYFANRTAINMAVFGGNDTDTINKYASEVLEIVQGPMQSLRNLSEAERDDMKYLMPVIEQLWGSYILQSKYSKRVTYVLTELEISKQIPKEDIKLTHMQDSKIYLQKDPKKLFEVISKIENHLKEINPEVHSAVCKFTSSPTTIDNLMETA